MRFMIGIIIKALLYAYIRIEKFLVLYVGTPKDILLGALFSLAPGGATAMFAYFMSKGSLTVSWAWIIVPIILDIMEVLDLIRLKNKY